MQPFASVLEFADMSNDKMPNYRIFIIYILLKIKGNKVFYILVPREVCKIRNEIKLHFIYEEADLL